MSTKYYLYISDTKIEMLLPQIADPARRKVAAEFKVNVAVLSASFKSETASPPERTARLAAVAEFLGKFGRVGSISNPDDYVFGTLPLKMIITSRGSVLFVGNQDGALILLGGSAKHLIGAPPVNHTASNSSLLIVIEQEIAHLSGESGTDSSAFRPMFCDPGFVIEATRLVETLGGTPQEMEIMARRLHTIDEPARHLKRLVIASPLYVALADASGS